MSDVPDAQHEGEAAVSASDLERARQCVPGLVDRFGWVPAIAAALAEARRAERERLARELRTRGWHGAADAIRALPDDQAKDIPDAKP